MEKQEICVVLDNIRSRENVGSIFRTADAVGVVKLYLCGITPTPQIVKHETLNIKKDSSSTVQDSSDKIAKTALGAEKWVPWEYHKQTWRLVEKLKEDGYQVIALEKTKTAKNIFGFNAGGKPIALVVGNEVSGLSTDVLNRSSGVVIIPMRGIKESLNVAVAFGVAIYQLSKEDK